MKELFDKIWNMPADQLIDTIFYAVLIPIAVVIVGIVILNYIANRAINNFKNKDRHKIFKEGEHMSILEEIKKYADNEDKQWKKK